MRKISIVLFLLLPTLLFGQDSLRTGVKYGVLPVLSFNSDDGIFLGAEIKRYDYREVLPFKSYTRIAANYKTNGAFSLGLSREEVDIFGSDLRISWDFFSSQNFADYYLGDTDKTPFDRQRFDTTSYYSFKSFRVNFGGATRFPISKEGATNRFDFKAGLRIVYEAPWGTPETRFINAQNIEGNEGAFLTLIDLGLVLERRNSEFRAQKGYQLSVGSKYAPPGISTHHTMENYVRGVGFLPLSKKMPITLATKLGLQNTVGETPYWFTPFLGGGSSFRGYMYRRFSSDNALSYTVEIRSWLLKIPFKNIELGLTLFMDGGKVFSNDNWDSILANHNMTLGFGGVMAIFTPDYILKYDFGFSEDGLGIYLGTGYSF